VRTCRPAGPSSYSCGILFLSLSLWSLSSSAFHPPPLCHYAPSAVCAEELFRVRRGQCWPAGWRGAAEKRPAAGGPPGPCADSEGSSGREGGGRPGRGAAWQRRAGVEGGPASARACWRAAVGVATNRVGALARGARAGGRGSPSRPRQALWPGPPQRPAGATEGPGAGGLPRCARRDDCLGLGGRKGGRRGGGRGASKRVASGVSASESEVESAAGRAGGASTRRGVAMIRPGGCRTLGTTDAPGLHLHPSPRPLSSPSMHPYPHPPCSCP
jgi:hypothetical protein